MVITEVRIKLANEDQGKLLAFASVTLDDCFCVRDVKILDGEDGIFIAMPCRRLAAKCDSCGSKNHMRARYCNECGKQLGTITPPVDRRGHPKLFADQAHPVTVGFRNALEEAVLNAYEDACDTEERGKKYLATRMPQPIAKMEATSKPFGEGILDEGSER